MSQDQQNFGSNFAAIQSGDTNCWPSRHTGKVFSDLNARDGGGHNCCSKIFTELYNPSLQYYKMLCSVLVFY